MRKRDEILIALGWTRSTTKNDPTPVNLETGNINKYVQGV